MSVTALQRRISDVLRTRRQAGDQVAGSSPLHLAQGSARVSREKDLFPDARAALEAASEADMEALAAAGCHVSRLAPWSATCRVARVAALQAGEYLDIEWAQDRAVRFFPVQGDDILGWALHPFDLACNTALALAARSATLDLVDIVAWAGRYPLPLILWAACGKDADFNPLMLLARMRRCARIDPHRPELLTALNLDPVQLKLSWVELSVVAEERITALADAQPELAVGVAFLDAEHQPRWPEEVDVPLAAQGLTPHPPGVGCCWPRLHLPQG